MARNGSGTYSRVASTPYVYNTVIDQVVVNAEMDDIATALTASIAKDGQTTPTANLPMGTYRHTNVGAASARTDYARASQVQDSSLVWCGTGGGTVDAITLTPSPAITAYATGQTFRFISSGANTGAATVNVSSVGAKSIKKDGTSALVAGDIQNGAVIEICYDGTNFQLIRNGAANREEGTFTPVVNFGGATTGITYTTQTGTYTKIGNVVVFVIHIVLSSKGSATGAATITGLPFTSANLTAVTTHMETMTLTSGDSPQGYVTGTSIYLGVIKPASSATMTDTNFNNTSTVLISGIYRV